MPGRSHGRRQPGERAGPAVRPRTAAVPELRRHVLLVQRAYFSAWRMVFDVPSGMSAGMRVLPCGPLGGMVDTLRHHHGIGRVTRRAERKPIDRHDTVRTDAGIRRAKEDFHRLAVDVVVARDNAPRSVRPAAETAHCPGRGDRGCLAQDTAASGKSRCQTRTPGRRIIADGGRQMPIHVMMMLGGQAELLQVVACTWYGGRPRGPLGRRAAAGRSGRR